ncbi:hypothetical protein AEYBE204_16280 [Asticcacaulis sp. YBE204]|nr:hypothetical protein AEYBE204_16280 [Asticcacaulis sp. YBE204]
MHHGDRGALMISGKFRQRFPAGESLDVVAGLLRYSGRDIPRPDPLRKAFERFLSQNFCLFQIATGDDFNLQIVSRIIVRKSGAQGAYDAQGIIFITIVSRGAGKVQS